MLPPLLEEVEDGQAVSCESPKWGPESPKWGPSSPAASRLRFGNMASITLQLQQFLDDWYFRIVHTKLGKTWSRKRALRAALDVLEINGVCFTDGDKDKVLEMQDEAMVVEYIADLMDADMRKHFDHIAAQLIKIVSATARVKTIVEKGTVEDVQSAFANDSPVQHSVLRKAVAYSSKRSAQVMQMAAGWRENSQTRLYRLQNAAREAEDCQAKLLRIEAQLAEFTGQQSDKSKSVLMGLVEKNSAALAKSVFSAWVVEKDKALVIRKVREELETRIAMLEQRLFDAQERQLSGIKRALMKSYSNESEQLTSLCFKTWFRDVQAKIAEGDTQARVQAAQKRLACMKVIQKVNAGKVMTRMAADSRGALLELCMQTWAQFSAEYKKNKDYEDRVKASEQAINEHLAKRKEDARAVMDRMSALTDSGLMALAIQNWAATVAELKAERLQADQLMQGKLQFKSLQSAQLGNVRGVQGRINEQMNTNLCLRVFLAWLFDSKSRRVTVHFESKISGKRKQLHGIQNLFKSFAAQLEQGLQVDDDDDSARGSSSHSEALRQTPASTRSVAARKSRANADGHHRPKGFSRNNEGAVSLPDIHKRPTMA